MSRFLDELSARVLGHLDGLWQWTGEGVGGFRGGRAGEGVNLLASTDAAWIGWAVGLDDAGGTRRGAWVRWLQDRQDPATGRFVYEPESAQNHTPPHAFWQAVRSLWILGGDLRHFPHYLRPCLSAEGLAAWFDGQDWTRPPAHHHGVLGLVPVLASRPNEAWADMLYRKIVEQHDPVTGTWPAGGPVDISRTFAYTCLHWAADRLVPGPDRVLDAMLTLQRPDGLWESVPHFHTMDAVYLLVRLPGRLGHRTGESRDALARLGRGLRTYVDAELPTLLENTHRTLAVVQTFSLLQEALPEEYPSERSWRFEWDVPAQYASETIRRG